MIGTSPVCPAPNPLLLSWVAHLIPSQQAGKTWPSHRDPEVHPRMMYGVCCALCFSMEFFEEFASCLLPWLWHLPSLPATCTLLSFLLSSLLPSHSFPSPSKQDSSSPPPPLDLVSYSLAWSHSGHLLRYCGQHRKERRRRHKRLAAPHRKCPALGSLGTFVGMFLAIVLGGTLRWPPWCLLLPLCMYL